MLTRYLSKRLRYRPGYPIHPKRVLKTPAARAMQGDARSAVIEKIESGEYQFVARPCPLCEGHALDLIADVDRFGFRFPMAMCRQCGFVHANPVLRKADYAHFYTHYYRPLHSARVGMPHLGTLTKKKDRNAELLNKLHEYAPLAEFRRSGRTRVLDVGCGAGNFVWAWQLAGFRPVGIDLNEAYMDVGRAIGLDLRVATLQDMTSESWDIISYHHVFEHILDPLPELELAYDILADDGILILVVPGLMNVPRKYQGDLRDYFQLAHVSNFTAETLSAFAVSAGFEIEHVDKRIYGIFRKTSGKFHAEVAPADWRHYEKAWSFMKQIERGRKTDYVPRARA